MTNEPSQRRRDKDFLKKMSVEEKRTWARGIVHRLMKAWQVKEMKDIADHVGGHLRMPSAWIQKGFVPWEVIYTCHLDTGCSLDWLYNGNFPVFKRTEGLGKAIKSITKEVLTTSGSRLNIIKEVQTQGFNVVSNSITSALVAQLSAVVPE